MASIQPSQPPYWNWRGAGGPWNAICGHPSFLFYGEDSINGFGSRLSTLVYRWRGYSACRVGSRWLRHVATHRPLDFRRGARGSGAAPPFGVRKRGSDAGGADESGGGRKCGEGGGAAALTYQTLRMDQIHFAPPDQPWDTIVSWYLQSTFQGFLGGAGFCPSTVVLPFSFRLHRLSFPCLNLLCWQILHLLACFSMIGPERLDFCLAS